MKKLFLDDIRFPADCGKYMYPRDLVYFYEDEDWDIVRTYDDFVGYIRHFGVPDLISFDHDLADEHYDSTMNSLSSEYNNKYKSFKEKTGYDCAKWLSSYCLENSIPLPTYIVHSMNPIGKDNILSLLDNHKKHENFSN